MTDSASKAQRLYLDLDGMTGVEGVEAIAAALNASWNAGVEAAAAIVNSKRGEGYTDLRSTVAEIHALKRPVQGDSDG